MPGKKEIEKKSVFNQRIEYNSKEPNKKIIEFSKISLWLDEYNDIFSDFDPRLYSEKALSDDFLSELKRATVDTTKGKIELNLLIPQNKRSFNEEKVIKKRLREHFKKHENSLKQEVKEIKNTGLKFALAGVIIMIAATYISVVAENKISSFLYHLIIVLLEPAGWFTFWEGLYQIFFTHKEKQPNLEFYKKMAECGIYFHSY